MERICMYIIFKVYVCKFVTICISNLIILWEFNQRDNILNRQITHNHNKSVYSYSNISNIGLCYLLYRMAEPNENEAAEPTENEAGTEEQNDKDFRNGWEFSDVTFKCDDGETVHASRYALCEWSPVFKTMLMTENFKEKDQNIIELPGKKASDLVKLMEVIHIPPKPITG